MQKEFAIAAIACVIAVIALVLVLLNMSMFYSYVSSNSMGGGHDMGGMSGSMGGGHDMGGMDHSMSTSIQEVCHQASGMPPHYCEPKYKTMSSVAGIKISKVEPISNTEVRVIIQDLNTEKVSHKLVLVGGSGYLSGATVIEEGWTKNKAVHLRLDGTGTIYDFSEMHLHLFPHTE